MSSAGQETVTGALPRHYLKPCLLLLVAEGPSHGYELLEQVRRLGMQGAEPGGLYRYLRSMEKEELVRSWWEPSQAGPARRTYVLTDAGRRALQASVDSLRDVRQLLIDLLDRYDSLAQTGDGYDSAATETPVR
ncbi:MAG TPA: PadR family transcriptional regulator [Acidimicrobiales bacterium]|jgi:poly-beta-hydroxybutyrate-responsive repressor|nr:PadR family transcriptional regulator [Acidimicrobiales bacterium]